MPPFYQNVVPLDRTQHTRFKLRRPENFSFAADIPLLPALTQEFAPLSREYPIVFLREKPDSDFIPVVLTGMPDGKNVFLDEAGAWHARYVPAFVRRYPFVYIETAADQFTLCFDSASKCLDENEGTPLFGEDNQPGSALNDIMRSLGEYQQAVGLTKVFMQRLMAANILMEANAKSDLPDGRSFTWRGFWMVDEARFRELPEATLKEWFASGELALLYVHLLSLGNLAELLRRSAFGAAAKVTAP
jgi:hypothetical protein